MCWRPSIRYRDWRIANLMTTMDMGTSRTSTLVDALFFYVDAKLKGGPTSDLGTIIIEKAKQADALLDFGSYQVAMDDTTLLLLHTDSRLSTVTTYSATEYNLWITRRGWQLMIDNAANELRPWTVDIFGIAMQDRMERMFGEVSFPQNPLYQGGGKPVRRALHEDTPAVNE